MCPRKIVYERPAEVTAGSLGVGAQISLSHKGPTGISIHHRQQAGSLNSDCDMTHYTKSDLYVTGHVILLANTVV